MNRLLLPVILLSCCVVCCSKAVSDETKPPADPKLPTMLDVRLVDVDGNPVDGASVGTFAMFSTRSKDLPRDESGWSYFPKAVSDRDGMAHLTDEFGFDCVVARHIGRKLAAIERIGQEHLNGAVTVTMHPQCHVAGQLISKELKVLDRKIGWSNVYLYLDDKHTRPMSCESENAEFHFFVPPGAYSLEAYSVDTHAVWKTITVKPHQQEMGIEPFDLPPTRLALLEGQPAPELQDIVAWKNSGPIKLSNLRGKVVILEFWGYWCGPCVGYMPELFAVYDKYRDQGLEVIGVHIDVSDGIDSVAKLDEKVAEVRKRLWQNRDIPFPVALVLEHRVPHRPDVEKKAACRSAADYGITGVPTGVLINRQGQVVGSFYTGHKPSEAVLESVLSEK